MRSYAHRPYRLRGGFRRALPVALLILLAPSRTHGIVGGEVDDTQTSVVGIGDMRPRCSGTVIGPRVVLTAAHCVSKAWSRYVFVADSAAAARKVRIVGVRTHPRFDPLTLEHDVAVLQLESDAGVAPMALGTALPAVGQRITIAGFGDGREASAPQRVRRAGAMLVTESAPSTFRARPGPASACGFDSGGAALSGSAVVGVINCGDLLCSKFTMFARVDAHLRFIQSAVAELTAPPREDGRPMSSTLFGLLKTWFTAVWNQKGNPVSNGMQP